MPYLAVTFDGEVTELSELTPDVLQNAVDGDIDIYKVKDGHFWLLTPCDETDVDTWSRVEEGDA